MIFLSAYVISYNPVLFAQGYQNSPILPEGTDPPVIITQVELDSAFSFLPDNQTCYDKPGFDSSHTCSTNIIPGHKVQCGYFIGSKTCEPIHQYTNGTNKNCLGGQDMGNGGALSAPQWFDIYNIQDKPVQIQYFDVKVPSTLSTGITESGPYYSMPEIGPHEKCSFTFFPIDQAMSLDPTNRTMMISYDYDGKHYAVSTVPLTDSYNDSRTWQFDGNHWTFAEQNTVTVPEFPFAVPILLIGITSIIVFYIIKFGK